MSIGSNQNRLNSNRYTNYGGGGKNTGAQISAGFTNLPIDELIGAPLKAAAQAQAALAEATNRFINEVCIIRPYKQLYNKDGTMTMEKYMRAQDVKYPTGERPKKQYLNEPAHVVYLDFIFNTGIAQTTEPLVSGEIQQTTNGVSSLKKLSVPLLAVLNIPNLLIQSVSIEFDMTIEASSEQEDTSEYGRGAGVESDNTVGGSVYGFGGQVTRAGSNTREFSGSSEKKNENSSSASYRVSVEASDKGVNPNMLIMLRKIVELSSQPTIVDKIKSISELQAAARPLNITDDSGVPEKDYSLGCFDTMQPGMKCILWRGSDQARSAHFKDTAQFNLKHAMGMAIYKKQLSGDKGWEKVGPKLSLSGEYSNTRVSTDLAAIEAGGGIPGKPGAGALGFIPLDLPLGQEIRAGDKWRFGEMTSFGYGGSRTLGDGTDKDASRDLAKGMNVFLDMEPEVISYEMGNIYPSDLDQDVNMNEIFKNLMSWNKMCNSFDPNGSFIEIPNIIARSEQDKLRSGTTRLVCRIADITRQANSLQKNGIPDDVTKSSYYTNNNSKYGFHSSERNYGIPLLMRTIAESNFNNSCDAVFEIAHLAQWNADGEALTGLNIIENTSRIQLANSPTETCGQTFATNEIKFIKEIVTMYTFALSLFTDPYNNSPSGKYRMLKDRLENPGLTLRDQETDIYYRTQSLVQSLKNIISFHILDDEEFFELNTSLNSVRGGKKRELHHLPCPSIKGVGDEGAIEMDYKAMRIQSLYATAIVDIQNIANLDVAGWTIAVDDVTGIVTVTTDEHFIAAGGAPLLSVDSTGVGTINDGDSNSLKVFTQNSSGEIVPEQIVTNRLSFTDIKKIPSDATLAPIFNGGTPTSTNYSTWRDNFFQFGRNGDVSNYLNRQGLYPTSSQKDILRRSVRYAGDQVRNGAINLLMEKKFAFYNYAGPLANQRWVKNTPSINGDETISDTGVIQSGGAASETKKELSKFWIDNNILGPNGTETAGEHKKPYAYESYDITMGYNWQGTPTTLFANAAAIALCGAPECFNGKVQKSYNEVTFRFRSRINKFLKQLSKVNIDVSPP